MGATGTELGRTLGRMTWPEVTRPIVVVPVGSCEQHGPHLPIATDTLIATRLATELVSRRFDAVVAPALAITASGEHQGFPGTLSIGSDVLTTVLVEIARSADWASGVVFVNGHGGNRAALQQADNVFKHECRNVLIWSPSIPGGDLHAGHTETSLLLALAPEQVRLDRAVAGPTPSLSALIEHGVRALSDTGVLGDPTHASAADGERIFRNLCNDLASAVAAWMPAT
jgi:mycofactocin precursor peptide peptidase